MVCSNCGAQNSEGATYCVNCGSVLMDLPSQPATGQNPSNYPAAPPKTYGLAVAAFVMGLLCMTCFLWPLLALPAIICAIIALVKISSSDGRLKGTELAVVGLVIPAVLTVALPLLFAFLVPVVSQARNTGQKVVCLTNMRTLATGMMMYVDEHETFPPPEQWCDVLIEEANVSPEVFWCPEDASAAFGYAVNRNVYAAEPEQLDPQMVLFFESDLGSNAIGGAEDVVFRHMSGRQLACIVSFVDGHVELVTQDRIDDLKWTAE